MNDYYVVVAVYTNNASPSVSPTVEPTTDKEAVIRQANYLTNLWADVDTVSYKAMKLVEVEND